MFKSKGTVGKRLRSAREEAGLSGRELARLLKCNQSFLSKIEGGKIKPSDKIVRGYSKALKLSAKQELELLALTEAFLFSFDRWTWEEDSGVRSQESVLHRIEQAESIDIYSHHLISGFIQSKAYATAVFEIDAPSLSASAVEAAVNTRMMWQKIKNDPSKQIRIILSENALGNWILPKELMGEQLGSILKELQEGKAEVRIVPQEIILKSLPMGPFAIYDDLVVTVETQTMELTFWEEEELKEYRKLYELLRAQSVTGGKAVTIIKDYIARLSG